MERERKNHWGYLLIGILYLLVSLLVFRNPAESLLALTIVFAVTAIIAGVVEITVNYKEKKEYGAKANFSIFMGVVDILIGIFFLWNFSAGMVALPIIFAIWFIVGSVANLFTLDFAKMISNGYYWFSLIVNILSIIVGGILLFHPILLIATVTFLVGCYFLINGILAIIVAF
ncbi:HdeD family acid-resistance protein [Enterococcus rivorum]|uniref:Acid-resistance membrane protein n=1 Tax=Enterococcus rivorum TaxID=762845 RepID=A0A1E5KS52_9ENTE|nr:DUF308 domain-containing protein [Enterococcus rivorum]MBP2097366.1 uncharacterized membrane protein HdeD (DUF308 family) [Enterococcus rivorum]OEH80717.1 hypothetical protein BCR26_06850 [Enterococcus rivorum]